MFHFQIPSYFICRWVIDPHKAQLSDQAERKQEHGINIEALFLNAYLSLSCIVLNNPERMPARVTKLVLPVWAQLYCFLFCFFLDILQLCGCAKWFAVKISHSLDTNKGSGRRTAIHLWVKELDYKGMKALSKVSIDIGNVIRPFKVRCISLSTNKKSIGKFKISDKYIN